MPNTSRDQHNPLTYLHVLDAPDSVVAGRWLRQHPKCVGESGTTRRCKSGQALLQYVPRVALATTAP